MAIEVEGLTKRYGERTVIDDLSFRYAQLDHPGRQVGALLFGYVAAFAVAGVYAVNRRDVG